ncbi:MAG: c-type cytochrome [Bacteroidales bacterium]|nr:c-type cytochrome [Bacteroidales bacterium]
MHPQRTILLLTCLALFSACRQKNDTGAIMQNQTAQQTLKKNGHDVFSLSLMRFPALLLLLSMLFSSCHPSQEETHKPTPYNLPQPVFFPTANNIPADNPMTEEGVALGEKLFFNGVTPNRHGIPTGCASCHHPEYSFEGGPEATLEHLGTEHTMLPLINLVWNTSGLGWKGEVETLEDMVYAAVTSPVEINTDTSEVVRYLQQDEAYPELFLKAFGSSEITFVGVEKAIAQYVRSLVFANSKFDRYLRGEEQLSQDELNGYMLFITEEGADCFHCHGGGSNALFTTNLLYNNGLDAEYHGDFKAPTLRNVALTAPYMHDGRFHSLDEVIDFYSDSVQYSEFISPLMHHVMQGGIRLTPQEKQQLKAFLNTLTENELP